MWLIVSTFLDAIFKLADIVFRITACLILIHTVTYTVGLDNRVVDAIDTMELSTMRLQTYDNIKDSCHATN